MKNIYLKKSPIFSGKIFHDLVKHSKVILYIGGKRLRVMPTLFYNNIYGVCSLQEQVKLKGEFTGQLKRINCFLIKLVFILNYLNLIKGLKILNQRKTSKTEPILKVLKLA